MNGEPTYRLTPDMTPPEWRWVLRIRADATSYADATNRILTWAAARQSRVVCVANVHMTMESYDSEDYRRVVNGADLVTPDGMPLVWALRLMGVPHATRVYGPRLTTELLAAAAAHRMPVGFYGGTESLLGRLVHTCRDRFPALEIAYAHAPPFRPLSAAEDQQVTADVNGSGARILFVGLGCPKQERWMAAHAGRVSAAMVGVGAAFDFLAGDKPQAPTWMQAAGLEWVFRLATEPRRLWRRYAYHNPRFVVLFTRQLLTSRIP